MRAKSSGELMPPTIVCTWEHYNYSCFINLFPYLCFISRSLVSASAGNTTVESNEIVGDQDNEEQKHDQAQEGE